MSKNNKIRLLIALIALLIILGLVFFITRSDEDEVIPVEEQNTINQLQFDESARIDKPPGEYIDATAQIDFKKEVSEDDVTAQKQQAGPKTIAITFVERIGSFSNQSNFVNIDEINPLMSASFKKWAEEYIRKEKAKQKEGSEYYGIETRVISHEFLNFDYENGKAELRLNTQRTEYKGNQRISQTKYQKAYVALVREGDRWLVDVMRWE